MRKETGVEVRLSAERERFVHRLVSLGRYASPSAAIEAALRLLETQETDSAPKRAVTVGLEQALAGRSGVVTPQEIVQRAARREWVR